MIGIVLTPLLCSNSSTERMEVNVVSSVMMPVRLHLTGGRHGKDFQKKFSSVGMQINVYGGKTGRAMIKYPPYKKNNSRNITPAYPGSKACRSTRKNLPRSCYILVW